MNKKLKDTTKLFIMCKVLVFCVLKSYHMIGSYQTLS